MQSYSEKCTKWYGNGPKMANFGPNALFFGHKRPQRPQRDGKSGTIGGSQLNMCGGTTLDAKFARKLHLVVWKWPKVAKCQKSFLAQNGQIWGHFHTTGCIFLTSFAPRVVPPHVFHCDPPFYPLLPAMGGLWGHLWPKMAVLAQNWPFLGPFHTIRCTFLTSFASRVVSPYVFH